MAVSFDHPLQFFSTSVLVLAFAAFLGERLRRLPFMQQTSTDFTTTLPAALTLLALILGFSFSMAVSRYDLRKGYEESEANAIGTEYVRASLINQNDGTTLRKLLVYYTKLRIEFYHNQNDLEVQRINLETAQIQNTMWQLVVTTTADRRDPVSSLVIAGMNDVLNSQGYTQAAWWNRIPRGAWILLALIAVTCNLLVGFCETRHSTVVALVLPVIVAVAVFLIADIDSPRHGVIKVTAQNLVALAQSFPRSN